MINKSGDPKLTLLRRADTERETARITNPLRRHFPLVPPKPITLPPIKLRNDEEAAL